MAAEVEKGSGWYCKDEEEESTVWLAYIIEYPAACWDTHTTCVFHWILSKCQGNDASGQRTGIRIL